MTKSAIETSWSDERREEFLANRGNRVARNAVTSDNIMKAARNASTLRTYHDTFSVSRPKTGEVTNQRHSGRCWMFSSFNVLRAATMKLLDVDTFEFSQAFGMFYDKLEKSNTMLENVIALIDRPIDDRALCFVLEEGVGDGGYYPYAMNLVSKWGIVPKDAMPESACSKDSTQMNAQLERLLHRDASILRAMHTEGADEATLRAEKEKMLEEVWRLLAVCLGEPPVRFDFVQSVGKNATVDETKVYEQTGDDRKDASKVADDAASKEKDDDKPRCVLCDRAITPREFAERYVPIDPQDYVELVSIPGKTRPFGTAWHIRYMDSVQDGRQLRMLNVDQHTLEQAAIASLKAGVPCEMACDVMQEFPRGIEDFPGILALDTMDYDALFDVNLSMERAEMYDMRESSLTHAMTFQGVELDEQGEPVAWRVENSWGKDACKDGYLVVSAEWFRLYGGEVSVRREFVDAETLRQWDETPATDVDPWSAVAAAVAPKV